MIFPPKQIVSWVWWHTGSGCRRIISLKPVQTLRSYLKNEMQTKGMVQVVKHSPSKHEGIGSIPSTTHTQKIIKNRL
jgi:hypothetical protein